ncbi:GNAT family N-acetyltransferase [Spirosoma utsteinense]|uniref:Ribosomal-protein-alanine N-acetyltransferase n=1 Tax=Spirosoma utsteinense TaxID=2585773 RepID=A0ABR6W5C7_9BACT|nr:GNAT family N-acetyltransferase [Spirosoma utsteinense]MBC3785646.1 ribosomal-protein-alanine N-acetyltransferase [Spirosoma utsteinense]MBC3791797.1 ribosomal-protein-alanine N-acetyltransferase [Spirosoma utsteinense]
MPPFILQTNRLTLMPVDVADLPELQALFTDPDVRRYLLDDLLVEEAWTADVVNRSVVMFRDLSYGLWAIRETGQRSVIGFCGYWYFEHLPHPLQLIYGLLPAWWGQGLATEAARIMLDYGFETVGFTEIIAATDVPNRASVRVMERLGLTHLVTDEAVIYYSLLR